MNYGTEICYQDVNADPENIVPLHVHVRRKRNKEQEYVDEKLGKKRKRKNRISVNTVSNRLASVRPDNGPDVDMNVFGFIHDMADFDAFHPWMGHDLFCRPP